MIILSFLYITKWRIFYMKNFDNQTHNFYTQTYFYSILFWDNLYALVHFFLQSLTAWVSGKSCSKQDLIFDNTTIFIHYKIVNLGSITNENNKNQWKMATHPWSSVQNFDNQWFWIRENKHITNLIIEQHDIDKIYLYARDLNKPKYEILIKKLKIQE